jgi:hypothetical protein
MSRQNLANPITVLLAGVIVIAMLLVAADPRTAANERAQEDTTPTTEDYPYPSPGASASSTVTGTRTPTVTPGTVTPSATATRQTAATPTGQQTALTDTAATETAELAESDTPTTTPTATPSNQLACVPGVPVEIAGAGPPRAAYLIYFGDRAVGGGSIEADGTFHARLIVGQERAGDYDVTVRVRGTQQVLRQITCSVPATTPTPLPDAGTLR